MRRWMLSASEREQGEREGDKKAERNGSFHPLGVRRAEQSEHTDTY